ncbi:hypothetical protein EC9_29690 [Rosistilla ulvae]|uniref:Uncharacterized protein n=1 Tax=Rosistilla ulvae TaxID=1930277 RepID=A0A517M1L4_9BACT|nr:hypothetical protein [Rosistilla ulvae]QDS88774.1 hypothetical protein EC9_29690 [Rosistilla ulvae]
MALTLSVGLQKNVGLPDYGSLCASCHVEFEIDRSLIDNDLEGFHRKVAGAFAACRQAVNDQLVQQSAYSSSPQSNGKPNSTPHHNGHAQHSGNGQSTARDVGTATQSQVRAIFAIARRQRVDPASLVHKRFNVDRIEDLSLREASTLIDELKRGLVESRA